MKEFEDYQKAKQTLLSYFDNPPEFYPVNALLNVEWKYDRDEFMLRWTEGGEDYSDYVLSVYDGEAYTMFLVETDFGDKELVIFDKQKELNNAE